MDEFKFQIYLSNIERLKGTKGPLKKIITELFTEYLSTSYFDTEQAAAKANVIQLIFTAGSYSTLSNPFTKAQTAVLYDYTDKIIRNYSLTPEELYSVLEFYCLNDKPTITIYPSKVPQYVIALRYKQALEGTALTLSVLDYSLKLTESLSLDRIIRIQAHMQHGTKAPEVAKSRIQEDLISLDAAIAQAQILRKDLHEYINTTDVE